MKYLIALVLFGLIASSFQQCRTSGPCPTNDWNYFSPAYNTQLNVFEWNLTPNLKSWCQNSCPRHPACFNCPPTALPPVNLSSEELCYRCFCNAGNPCGRCRHYIFVIDVSTSMNNNNGAGASSWQKTKNALAAFVARRKQVQEDQGKCCDTVSLITFGTTAQHIYDQIPLCQFNPELLPSPSGSSNINLGLNLLLTKYGNQLATDNKVPLVIISDAGVTALPQTTVNQFQSSQLRQKVCDLSRAFSTCNGGQLSTVATQLGLTHQTHVSQADLTSALTALAEQEL